MSPWRRRDPDPREQPEPPQRIPTWWERLRGAERGRSGDGSSLRGDASPGRMLLAGVSSVLFALVGITALALAPGQREDNERLRAAGTCTAAEAELELQSPQSPSCLVRVPGVVDDYRDGRGANLRWHFQPVAGSAADDAGAWVRFSEDSSDPRDWTAVQRSLFSGEPAIAYYWGEDPVLFETRAGRLESRQYREGAWKALLWVGGSSLLLAGMHPFSRWVRRRRQR